jgi:hypothetical protein
MPQRLAVVGSRTFSAVEVVRAQLRARRAELMEIVSGGAPGADALAAQVAGELGLPCAVLPADWRRWGPSAGPRRNAEIAARADAVLAFVDRPLTQCRGTRDVVERFRRAGKPIDVVTWSDRPTASAKDAP